MKHAGTPAGNRLRTLRENAGKTQLDVELDASLGTGYLQRIESGKVGHPERETLERILTALDARYTERRDILELFGYIVDTPPPDAEEIRWAVDLCGAEVNSAVFPAYLLDCRHEMLAWNHFAPKLFPSLYKRGDVIFTSMLRILFDPAYGVTDLIANPDVLFTAQIRAFRYEIRSLSLDSEAWHVAMLNDMRRNCPLFEHYWQKTEREESHQIAARPLFPMELNLPDIGRLRFWLTSERFAQDNRFRVIYYLPADTVTMQQCVAWVE